MYCYRIDGGGAGLGGCVWALGGGLGLGEWQSFRCWKLDYMVHRAWIARLADSWVYRSRRDFSCLRCL